ncbi:hypothetical protein PHMEG_00012085, partial [Phytophthora megakarya]
PIAPNNLTFLSCSFDLYIISYGIFSVTEMGIRLMIHAALLTASAHHFLLTLS